MSIDIEPDEEVEFSQYELVPPGVYNGEIIKIEKVDSPFKKGEFQYQFHFELNYKNSQGEPAVVQRTISKKLSPKSKLYELIAAVNGANPSKGKYSVYDLLGKSCKVVIKHQTSKNGNLYSRIDTFIQSDK